MLRLIRNRGGISKLSLTMLLVVAGIIGALISYMFVMGYYMSIGFRVPEETDIEIVGASFPTQSATVFNISILNPSYSPSNATVNQVQVITGDTVHSAEILQPSSRKIKPGELKNFTCKWDWSDDTGEEVIILAFIAEGSGEAFKITTPVMGITITETYFNAAETTKFNVTVKNSEFSVLDANITAIGVTPEGAQETVIANVTPTLFRVLPPNSSLEFTCLWNWTEYQGETVTISVYAVGYTASYPLVTPEEEESLNITKQHVWYNTSNSTSKAAFLIINTGDADAVIERITVRGQECNWSTVYWDRTNDTITADLPWIPGTPTSVNLSGTTYYLATSSGNATLYYGYTMIVYIVNPDTITLDDINQMVEITVYTSRATYSTQSIVEAAS